jgi:hypothetical protein
MIVRAYVKFLKTDKKIQKQDDNLAKIQERYISKRGPAKHSRYSVSLRARRAGDRISVGGEIFRTRPYRPWGPSSLLYTGYRVYSPEVKRPGCGVDHPPPSSAEIKVRVDLYLYSPYGSSWPVLRRISPFTSQETTAFSRQWRVLFVNKDQKK